MPLRDTWNNPDGLTVYFGPRYTENNIAGTAHPANRMKVLEITIRGEEIPASVADAAAAAIDQRNAYLPAGAYVYRSVFIVDEAFTSGGAATLDIGTATLSTSASLDSNGIDAAIAVASLTAGADIVSDGAQVGTKITAATRVFFGYNTAAFTGGSGRLILEFIEPPVQSS